MLLSLVCCSLNYLHQVLVKSCKMVPVMLMGTVFYGKRYSPLEYVCMTLVGVGVALFGKRGSHAVTSKLASPNTSLGYALCFLNLTFDGYTNAAQASVALDCVEMGGSSGGHLVMLS
jgi:solute carrier family 35 (UDP-galactose transporter), member B1